MPKLKRKSHLNRLQEKRKRNQCEEYKVIDSEEKKLLRLRQYRESKRRSRENPALRQVDNEKNRACQALRFSNEDKRTAHNVRQSLSQGLRLSNETQRKLHNVRNSLSQTHRLSNEVNRLTHNLRQSACQVRRLDDDENRKIHNQRQSLAQDLRLSIEAQRELHNGRNTLSQTHRLSNEVNRLTHNLRQSVCQVHRLDDDENRKIHNQRQSISQSHRLDDDENLKIHNKRQSISQSHRLDDDENRKIHNQRQSQCQAVRLNNGDNRAVHNRRNRDCQVVRLANPEKRQNHRLRLLRNQTRRFINKEQYEKHKQRAKEYSKRILAIQEKKRLHLKKMRVAQRRRLSNPLNYKIHIGRVINSRIANKLESEERERTALYDKFREEIREGPTHVCHCCQRLFFKTSVRFTNISKYDSAILKAACGVIDGDSVCLCYSCANSVRSKKIPTLSIHHNTDLVFPEIPKEIEILTELEERFLCPKIPFMSIRASIDNGQHLVKGRVINIGISIPASVNILPRTHSETAVVPICFKRKKAFKSSIAFEHVRPKVVCDAAKLLSESPIYKYFEINVDVERVVRDKACFPTLPIINHDNFMDGDPIFNDLNEFFDDDAFQPDNATNSNESDSEEDEPVNVHDGITMLQSDGIIFAPGEGRRPESLFGDYVEAQSFIKIYGGQLIKKPAGLSYLNWAKSEIMRSDRRCCHVTKLFFSALVVKTIKISSSISFCLRKVKGQKKKTAQELLDDNEFKKLEIDDNAYRLFRVDRTSPGFWDLKKKELFAMLRTLGAPQIFLTMSPSESKWLELIVILKRVVDDEVISEESASLLSYEEKARLVKNDPVTVARYFDYRMRRMFQLLKNDNCVFRKHKLLDWYIRVEFQLRGSPHIHSLLWLSNCPKYEENSPNEPLIDFIDTFISCSHAIPDDLLKLQTHRHTFTCKKGLKSGGRTCRFDIPFLPVKKTVILSPLTADSSNESSLKEMRKTRNEIQRKLAELKKVDKVISLDELLETFELTYTNYIDIIRSGLKRVTVFLKREPYECMINFYNPDILELHRANIDCQVVIDMYSIATYILNYLNKSNSAMSKLLREAAADLKLGNYTMKEQFRKLGNLFLNTSEFSAQEATYYLLGLPVSISSRTCQFINTSRPEKRVVVLKKKDELKELEGNSTNVFVKNVLDHYVLRPKSLEKLCLADFVALYNFSTKKTKATTNKDDEAVVNLDEDGDEEYGECFELLDGSGFLKKRRLPKIIRFVNYNEHHDDYTRENVMLFFPWRDEQVMMDSAEVIFEKQLKVIKENRGKYVYNEEIMNDLANAEQELNRIVQQTDDDNESTKTPQNLRVFNMVESQNRDAPDVDIDNVVPPDNDARPGNDVITVPVPIVMSEDEYSDLVSTLNVKQSSFLLHTLHRFKLGLPACQHVVLGGAGVGKSRLIQAIQQAITRHLNTNSSDLASLKVLLCGPTGRSAFGIRGTTLHAAFVLPLNQCGVDLVPLSSSTRNTLWSKLHDVKLIIIDEISMVGSRTIQQVDCRLRQIFQSAEPFAGLSIMCFGDFRQLAPVGDRYIFESHQACPYGELIGNPLWNHFTTFTLTEIMRQKDDKRFAEALNHLAAGTMTQEDIQLFKSRECSPFDIPHDAIFLFKTNAEVDKFNNSILDKFPNVVVVEAEDKVTGQPDVSVMEKLLKAAKNLHAKDAQGLPNELRLAVNVRYMITNNIDISDGLVNGAVGELREVEFSGSVLSQVWLEFPDEMVGKQRRQKIPHTLFPKWTSIEKIVRTIRPGKSKYSVVRKMLPMVPSESITICKSQGGTYNLVAFHFSRGLRRSEIYVGLSRCTKLEGLFITGQFVPPPPPAAADKVVREVKRLMSNSLTISCSLPNMFSEPTIVYHNVQSLNNKAHWAEFVNNLKNFQPAMFIAAETWTLPSDLISVEGYNLILRIDWKRNQRRHPYGLCIYVKDDFNAYVIDRFENDQSGEMFCFASLLFEGVAIVTGYKNPATSMRVGEASHCFQACLNGAFSASNKVTVMGDFNYDINQRPLPPFYANLMSNGLHSQLPEGTVTTDKSTAIDCLYSNFPHFAGVIETLYSYHKALLSVPCHNSKPSSAVNNNQVISTSQRVVPISSNQDNPITLLEAITVGKELFRCLQARKSKVDDLTKISKLLRFVRCNGLSLNPGRKSKELTLPAAISNSFHAISTTGDGNCFYYAVSRLLCGKESLALGLRALVAYHMEINEEFLDCLPIGFAGTTLRSDVLRDGRFAENLEVCLLSLILGRSINVHTGRSFSSQRFEPINSIGELHLYLDLTSQHYSSLLPRPNKSPPEACTVLLPQQDIFKSL